MNNTKQGFIALYLTLLVVFVLSGIGVSAFVLISSQQSIIQNTKASLQAYYGAEAGVEDALFRTKNFLNWSNPVVLSALASNVQITTTIVESGVAKTIVATGDDSSRVRKVEAIYRVTTSAASFFYGLQIGEGGVKIGKNSTIIGNIYSNGSLEGGNGAQVTGDVIVAGDGASNNEIKNITIDGNAWAPLFKDCSVGGNIVFVAGGGVDDCVAGGIIEEQAEPISFASFPITQAAIDNWKQEAQNGGVIAVGDYEPSNGSSETIGPGVIQGNMILKNNQSVTLNGTVYVVGNIDIDNGSEIRLSSAYGSSSGILLSDGFVHIKNNGELKGSGETDSYLMIITTSNCRGNGGDCTHHDAAMDIHNNAKGAIFYAGDGMINLHNNVEVSQVTAWKLELGNNTTLTYSLGLVSTLFSSGPGAEWELTSWKEIE